MNDVIVVQKERYFTVDSDNARAASFSVQVPMNCFYLQQDDPDDMDDPFAKEIKNISQIRWDEKDQMVSLFSEKFDTSSLEMLRLPYADFFAEFRKWHLQLVEKYKEKKDE